MFARKSRKNYRQGAYLAVILCLCTLIAAIAWPEAPSENNGVDPAGMNPDYVSGPAEDEIAPGWDEEWEYDSEDEDEDEDEFDDEDDQQTLPSENEETGIIAPADSYYLVKRSGTQIVVFFCDSSGNMVPLETTDILYSMLGPEDQKLFDLGIQVSSQEELGILLQDFEG